MPHSLEEYISLVTKDIWEFIRLCSVHHRYKEKEEEIFKTLYEDKYCVNYSELMISYKKRINLMKILILLFY